MLNIYKTFGNSLKSIYEIEDNSWVNLVSPSQEELLKVEKDLGIEIEDLKASLDDEEASRIEVSDDYTLILVDIPVKEIRNENEMYTTIPLAVILTQKAIVTVCIKDATVLKVFLDDRIKDLDTAKKMRFLYRILYSNTAVYQNCLRTINKKRESIEARLNKNIKNEDLIELHDLEINLVYFATSLRVNDVILNKLTRYEKIKQYPEDKELLEDVIIENKQAIEMTIIYRDIINTTTELFTTVINNRLNGIMKLLASITIVMAIPAIVSGLYGMNVDEYSMPFADNPYGFLYICLIVLCICTLAIIILKKKNLL